MQRKSKLNRQSINLFAEQFFPARPQELWSRARSLSLKPVISFKRLGLPRASNPQYIKWLKNESMLSQANTLATKFSGSGHMWRNPYAKPRPRAAIKRASVWYTAYPISIITPPNESILATLGKEELWKTFQEIGIEGMHTGPMKLAGGLDGWSATPSVDGHFDRISTRIDPLFGTKVEFKKMSKTAAMYNGLIIDDIVPGHTGKGADFRLATMGHGDYPGIYHMVEIYPEDWEILPTIPKGKDSANLDLETERKLKDRGYIVGRLQRVIFYEPGVKETNWSATAPVKGVDGIKRRWVYLHYFKEGQPSINWLDPSFSGIKLVIGDGLHSLEELETGGLRLDANGFLGVEIAADPQKDAWSEEHPLSETANQLISSMVRKLGGFTFQELNLSMDAIKTMSNSGADLSYDFVNRPAYHHALITSDTSFLQLTLRTALEMDIDPAGLVHAMQNHDELTYELVHFWTIHKDQIYDYDGQKLSGLELRERIRKELKHGLTHKKDYNLPFSENGIACTTATVIAAALNIQDISKINSSDINKIIDVHILLCMFNALQPGVFAISGWDLSGSLTLPADQIKDLIADGDTRWINRGAHDLLDFDPAAKVSKSGMPKSLNLYGSLSTQLEDDQSFTNKLRSVLAIRKRYEIATSRQIDIPKVNNKACLAMLHKLSDGRLQMTVLNFSKTSVDLTVSSEHLPLGHRVIDGFTQDEICKVNTNKTLSFTVGSYSGLCLIIEK